MINGANAFKHTYTNQLEYVLLLASLLAYSQHHAHICMHIYADSTHAYKRRVNVHKYTTHHQLLRAHAYTAKPPPRPPILTVVGGERQTEFEPGSRALSPCPRQPESVPYPAKIVSRHTERKEQTNSDT